MGTPFLVHFLRNLGARPSSERAYKFLTAQYVYVFPAEKMDVNRSLAFNQYSCEGRQLCEELTH